MNDDLDDVPEFVMDPASAVSPTGRLYARFLRLAPEQRAAMKIEMEERRLDSDHNEALAADADRDLQSGRTKICPKCLWAYSTETCDCARSWRRAQ